MTFFYLHVVLADIVYQEKASNFQFYAGTKTFEAYDIVKIKIVFPCDFIH